jgi:hypothetical protein
MVAAQTSSQQPTQSPVQGNSQQTPAQRGNTDARPTPPPATAVANAKDMTVTGCVMREGTNGFVLSNASSSTASANVAGGVSGSTSSGAAAPGSVGTSGIAKAGPSTSADAAGAAAHPDRYTLTGGQNLASYVGQRVEIVGSVEGGSVGTSGTTSAGAGINASGGVSDSKPSAGAGATDRAGSTQRLSVTSVKAISGACS